MNPTPANTTPAQGASRKVPPEDDGPIAAPFILALRLLTLAAGLVLAAGGVLLLRHSPARAVSFRRFHAAPVHLRFPLPILHAAFHGSSDALVLLGVLLLVAAPMLRVLAAGLGYLRMRDFLYVAVSAIVLAVLLFSFIAHR